MTKKPSADEVNLIGSWGVVDGSVVQDSVCERIQSLTDSYFEQIVVDGDNWSAWYRNPDDNSYWELTYPQSHMHGGGPPALQRVSDDYASRNYGVR